MEVRKSKYGDVEHLTNGDLIAIARDKCPLLANGSITEDKFCNQCEFDLFCIDWEAQNTVLATRLEKAEARIKELDQIIRKENKNE